MSRYDKDTGGLLNFSKAYHYIQQEVADAVKKITIAFRIPTAKVIGKNNPGDNQTSITAFTDNSTMIDMKPASMHFISAPVEKEITPVFSWKKFKFYGNPLPIYDSLANTAQIIPITTEEWNPNFGVSPIQITPGDVAVQGRYGHAMVFSDNYSRPTLRIGNAFRSRDSADVEQFYPEGFESDLETAQRSDSTIPTFFDPNIDGSSIYFLKNTAPGIDLNTEMILSGNDALVKYNKNVLTPVQGGMFKEEISGVNERMLISSDSIYIYTKGANHNNHNISVLSSGQLTLNSMKNVFITTPEVDDDKVSGLIYIGNNKNRGLLPNSKMQPAVRGLNYLQTMVGIAKASDGPEVKIGPMSILGLIDSLVDSIDKLAGGGLSVDGDGVSNSGAAVKDNITNEIRENINSLKKKIVGTMIEDENIKVWTGDVSKKVFVE